MTACFLFSTAGGESSRFNYFRNFSDPASAAVHRQNGLPTKAHDSSGPFIYNAGIYRPRDFL